jgi:hypothetical protein
VSGGSKLTKVTDGAGAVGFGTNGYMTTTSSDYNPGTGDFAIEGYFRFPDNSGTRRAFINETGTFGNNALVIRQYNTGFEFYCGGTSFSDSGYNMAQWNHAMITRSGSTVRIFVNGELRATRTTSQSISCNPTNQMTIGGYYSANDSEFMQGYASNLRLTVGSIPTDYQTSLTSVGVKVFTPSSEPLTSTSQGATSSDVKLLCCQSNTSANEAAVGQKAVLLNAPLSSTPFTDSSPTGATITNNGSITAVSAGTNSFNITNAASQNGSNQWITTNNTNISFQGSWTVDIYFKLDSSASGYNALINSGYGTQTSHYMYIGLNDDEYPYLETSSSGSRTLAQDPLSKNVWYHGRVTQDGSTMTFYVNGNSVVTKTAQTADLSSGGAIFTIGSLNNESAGSNSFHGLIGPVRILDTNIGAPSAGGDATSSGTLSNSFGDVVKVNGDAVSTTFNPFNTDINTVRGQESGYCTLNPLFYRTDPLVLSDGNLTAEATGSNGSGNWKGASSTFGQTSGKWFAEFTLVSKGGTNHANIGINPIAKTDAGTNHGVADSGHFYTSNGKFWNASTESGVIADQYLAGDVIGVTVDFDASEIKWYKNDVLQNTVSLNSNILASGFVWALSNYTTSTVACNFGQKPFKFPPPNGFQPLNNANVRPETVIARPDQYVGVKKYTGNGSAQKISFEFGPDLVWSKMLDVTSDHIWLDTLRGQRYWLNSNSTNGQGDPGENVITYNSDGFTVGDQYNMNADEEEIVAWCWRAGGSVGTFSKDDVGFANASDVNMGIGDLNSAAYNQSETWSTASAANEKAFDGSKAYDSTANRLYGNSTLHTVIDAATTFTNVKSVVVGTSENAGNITIDGVEYATTYISAVGLTVTNPPSTVRRIQVFGRSSGLQISYVQINGVLLVDNGVSVTNVPSIAPSSASIGTKNGFSIVKYVGNGTTNQSLPHGLSQAPDFVIIKNLSSSYGWPIYHKDSGLSGDSAHNSPEFKMLEFNQNGSSNFTEDCIWDVFDHSLRIHRSGSGHWLNDNTSNFIMYSWHSVPGLQKFGSYEGNSNDNGPYVELGFRPALLWIKNISTGSTDWVIHDNQRNEFNPAGKVLKPNTNGQTDSSTSNYVDFLSNGFKIRNSQSKWNGGYTYIYCAWAEAPTVNLYGGQSNAR